MDKKKSVSKGITTKGLSSTVAFALVGIAFTIYLYVQNHNPSIRRPQEPKGPFPYEATEFTFSNPSAGITLSGTLTIPANGKESHPAVILISGYGPQNRDGEWNGHKPFLLIADYLTRKGVAVFRYDDRGLGKSTGNYHAGTSLDFSTDVESAVQFLTTRKEIDSTKIGLIGHSDGAMIAPMVAARSTNIHFYCYVGRAWHIR